MRLLVLSNLYPPATRGGYEVECRDVVEHLRGRHEVTVLASDWRRGECPSEAHVRRVLPWAGDEVLRESVLAPVSALRAARATQRVLDEVRPDAIYVWNAGGLPAASLLTLTRAGLPLLFRVCEYWLDGYLDRDLFVRHLQPGERGLRGAWAAGLRLVDRRPSLRLRAVDPAPAAICWATDFVRRAAPAPPYLQLVHGAVVIPSNARTERLAELGAARRDPVPGRILYVGRLEAMKGPDILVRALGALRRDGDAEAHLVLVGDGTADERAALLALAEHEGVADAVRLPGPLRGEALEREIAAASAWCVPSRWDEPAGMTCIEAALARVPGVFARVGGIPELFTDGTHALLHERDDHAGCAAALAQVLAGGTEVQARVARALARGHELSWPPYLRAMDAFLDEGVAACVSRGSRPPG